MDIVLYASSKEYFLEYLNFKFFKSLSKSINLMFEQIRITYGIIKCSLGG